MFPKLERTRARESDRAELKGEHAEAISGLCRTYTHAISKLLYAFAGLKSAEDADGKTASISQALAKGERATLMEQISQTLSGGIEKVVRCDEVVIRTGVMRDLRARFKPAPKPTTCEVGVQADIPQKRAKSQRSLSANITMTVPELSDEMLLAQLRGDAPPPDEDKPPRALPPSTVLPPPMEHVRSRPGAENATPGFSGMYERQMEWARRKQAKIHETRVEIAKREAAEAAAIKLPSMKLYEHVESALRKERRAEEDGRVARAEEAAQVAALARQEAEERAKREEQERERMQQVMQRAEQLRMEAEAKMKEADERAREAEVRYEKARQEQEKQALQHKEELEIRDAFGEQGLEVWPMYPGKKILRVADSDAFDGRISQEFRVKDADTNEPGISLLMGRLATKGVQEVQCILFDTKRMTDLQAARWWEANHYRFNRKKLYTR